MEGSTKNSGAQDRELWFLVSTSQILENLIVVLNFLRSRLQDFWKLFETHIFWDKRLKLELSMITQLKKSKKQKYRPKLFGKTRWSLGAASVVSNEKLKSFVKNVEINILHFSTPLFSNLVSCTIISLDLDSRRDFLMNSRLVSKFRATLRKWAFQRFFCI